MNTFTKALLVSALLTLSASAQSLPGAFQQLLDQTSMQFSMPPDFQAASIVNNEDVGYDFAVRSNTGDIEIRYRIWPIDKTQKNPNNLYEPMITTMGLNISNGKVIQLERYPADGLKSEFGADAGCTGLVPIDSQFGKGFKLCVISVIHKDNIADAYVFYLYNDPKTIMSALSTGNVFHALKFK